MNTVKLKERIGMKETLENEIKESLIDLSEKAAQILIKNEEIFNNTNLKFEVYENGIKTVINSKIDFEILNELNNELNPTRITLEGDGSSGSRCIELKLFFD